MKAKETMQKMGSCVLGLALILLASQAVFGVDLKITPVDDFEPSGTAGGPFSPSSKDYELTNNGANPLYWGADETVDWLDLDPGWGQLLPHESMIVTVSLTAEANSLGGGVYTDTITFTDITNNEEQTREAILTISAIPGALEVTPVEDFESAGEMGGPFTPSYNDYQLTNSGGSFIYWGATKTATWLDLDSEFGLLDPCESTVVTVSLTSEVNSLGTGIYTDTLTFTDLTNAQEQTRGVTLTIYPSPIWIRPLSFDINTIEGLSPIETLTIGNNMTEDLNFMIRTRQVAAPGPSAERISSGSAGKGGILPVPIDHDFTSVGQSTYKPGELIVRFAANNDGRISSMAERNQILNSVGGGTIKYDFKIVPGLSVVKLPPEMTVEEAVQRFNKTNGILYAEPDYEAKAVSTFPDDTLFNELWGMYNTGQTGGTIDADIDAPEAWDIATGSHEIVVAVVDTGVDYTHIDLAANIWINEPEFNGTPGVDDDNNGYVDDIYGYDFCNKDGDPMDDSDPIYHGTHCSGTIGGVGNNSEGVAGVCWNVRIMAVKFLDENGSGWYSDAIYSIEYATLMGANLTSNSWGGTGYSQGLKDAIDKAGEAGMLCVAAAGNNDHSTDVHPHYPSSYDSESIISVMATDHYDNKSGFSNWGPVSVDLAAPGSSILSCKGGNGYRYLDGTSMATPHVSGACALLWSTNPVMSNDEVKDILLRTVDKTLAGLCVSEGRLNLYKAVLETKAPWIKIEPEAGTIAPGQSSDISVNFDAIELVPGTYQAEIVIISNESGSPRFVPVTMIVKADDLQVSPLEGFESIGTEGGPFEPQCTVYTLTNIGTGPVNWTTFETENWLEVLPDEGILGPSETIDVNVCISAEANSLDPNLYIHLLTFQNVDSGSIKPRSISLAVKPPDCFTESFSNRGSDLNGLMLTFSPDGSVAYYEACRDSVNQFPTDPNGGTYVPLWDDDYAEIILNDTNVLFYGHWYDRFYIGSNGYITFGQGDIRFEPLLENHFDMPRISGLFADLNPPNDECISYQQLDDRVVVTFRDVPFYGDKTATINFQIEMFFVDGTICITWLDTAPTASVVGLSRGRGLPPVFFEQSNLSSYPPCWPRGDFNRDYCVDINDLAILVGNWLCEDCNIPYWCRKTDLNFSSMVEMGDFAFFADNWTLKKEWLVSHWKFDEGQGTIAYDSAGTNDGTISGAAWVTGKINSALSFDGVDDYVDIPYDSSLDIDASAGITLSVWINLNTYPDNLHQGPIFGLYDSTDMGTKNYLVIGKSIYGNLITWDQSPPSYGWIDSIKPDLDTWYHVVVAEDSSQRAIYINGNLDVLDNISESYQGNTPDTIRIGSRADGLVSYYFDGTIDDVRIYEKALSAGEIWEIFRTGTGNKAFAPYPPDGAIYVDPNVVLMWLPGKDAISHDVYLGADYNDVNDATPNSDEYKGNYDVNIFDPCGLEFDTTYYWRVDEVGTLTTYKGDVWSFTTWYEFIPDCVSWWKFDEGTGTIAYDSVGNNHGDIIGATWTTGQINSALNFDGMNDYVDIPYDPSLDINPLQGISISVWINLKSYPTGFDQGPIFGLFVGTGDGTKNYLFIDKPLYGNLITWDQYPPYYGAIGSIKPDLDTWYHVAVVEDSTYRAIYINGSLDVSDNIPEPYQGNIPDTIRIGNRAGSIPFYFDGTIDDVRIYERALSAQEIWQLYQYGLMAGP